MATWSGSTFPPLQNDELKAMVYEIAPEEKIKVFEETLDVDFGYEVRALPAIAQTSFSKKTESRPCSV